MSETGKHEKDSTHHASHAHAQQGHTRESLVATKMPGSATGDVEVGETSDATELVFVENTSLSPAQNQTMQQMQRLYASLCGPRPGEYWPQSLLDTAGTFNRPPFPRQTGGR
jgi:hypothetical protein